MFRMVADVQDYHINYQIFDQHDDLIVEGSIKWDGCSNWDYTVDGVMLHFCSESEMKQFHKTMELCYVHARDYFGETFDE